MCFYARNGSERGGLFLRIFGIFVVSIITAIYSFAAQTGVKRDIVTLEYRTIERFDSHGEPGLQVVLRFGLETKIPVGLIRTNDQLCRTKIEITVQKEPM